MGVKCSNAPNEGVVTYVREEWIEGSEFTQKSWLGLIEESDLFSSLPSPSSLLSME